MATATPKKSPYKWKPSALTIIGVAVAFLGLLMGLYPMTASWLNEVNQTQASQEYVKETKMEADKAEQLELAHRYNKALNMGVDLKMGARKPTSAGEQLNPDLEYDKLLSSQPSGIMARLRIDKIGVDLPIYHGTSDEVLKEGAGHLEGSSLPVGGESTHTVITAHRGLANATMFNNLPKMDSGDTFTIEVFGEVLTYRVYKKETVEPEQTESLRAEAGKDLATLVTCTPLGINSHRMLVTGERVFPTPKKDLDRAGQPSDVPGFPWWILIFIGGTATLVYVFVKLSRVPVMNKKKDEEDQDEESEGRA